MKGTTSRFNLLWRILRCTAALPAALLLLTPREALACPVCFGAAEGSMIDAMNVAVLVLLGVTVVVLGGFVAFFVNLIRRSHAAVRQADAPGLASR